MRRLWLLMLCLCAMAQTKQKVEFGYFGTTGNTQTNSITAAYHLRTHPDPKTTLKFRGDILYSTRYGDKNNERYRARMELTRLYSRKFFSYFYLGFLRNVFQGYDQQYSINPGLGYRLIHTPTKRLSLKLGYELRRNNYTNQPHENFHYAKAQLHHLYRLTKKNRLKTTIDIIENIEKSQDYEIDFESSLQLHIVRALSFKISFELTYDHLPPAGKKSTDTVTKATIVYSF
ncbi:MAG: DUF481 domain-containing protein [Epsilonproteobacteria bacterium]|nr:DUF481 domain-containing protein [Campylobacterota bacterium]